MAYRFSAGSQDNVISWDDIPSPGCLPTVKRSVIAVQRDIDAKTYNCSIVAPMMYTLLDLVSDYVKNYTEECF